MDVVLISPMEVSLRDNISFRENNIENDVDNLKKNAINSLFLRQFRENIGIASLAAYLRKNGYSVKIINCNMYKLDVAEVVEEVHKLNPTLVGISMLYDLHSYNACRIVRDLRKIGFEGHICAGGPFSTLTYEFLLAGVPQLDSIIRGEGEIPLLKLTQAVSQGDNWKDISSVAYVEENEIVSNPCIDVEDNLDKFPLTSRDSLEELRKQGIDLRVASIYSSRGCKGNCTYCTAPSSAKLYKSKKWRCRSAQSVVDEIEYLVNEFDVNYFYFCDDNFFGYGTEGRFRLKEMAELIIERNLKIRFHAEVRVDMKLDIEILKLLKTAGLQDVLLGIESGAQSALNRWKKGTTVEQNQQTVAIMKELGFNIEPAMIMIDPYTTLEEFKETADFIKNTEIFDTSFPMHMFNKMIIFTGTDLYKQYIKDNVIDKKSPWSIVEDIDNDEKLLKFCRNMSSHDYRLQDTRMQTSWDILMDEINRLTWLVEDVFPDYLDSLRKKSREKKDKRDALESYSDLIKRSRGWRNELGRLSLTLMYTCIDWMEKGSNERELQGALKEEVIKYEREYFRRDLNTYLLELASNLEVNDVEMIDKLKEYIKEVK